MLVELGTNAPSDKVRHADPQERPFVVYTHIPDTYSFNRQVDTEHFRAHLNNAVQYDDSVVPAYDGSEALLVLTHPTAGVWKEVSKSRPQWVWSDDADMQRFLSEFHQCPAGKPTNYEGDYWRRVGSRLFAPGVMPYSAGPQNLVTNVGVTQFSLNSGGGQVGITGLGTAATATTFTTASTLVTNAWAGYRIYVADTTNHQIVWGNVISNTNAASASVVTVDQWYNPGTPGGAAATTPAAGFEWVLADGGTVSSWFMGITTTNITPAATDTSLSGEATTNGMGRKIASYTVTSAASGSSITITVSTVYTYTGSGATTFYAMGLFPSMVKADTTDTLTFETSFSGSFTVTNNGDTATVTDSQVIS